MVSVSRYLSEVTRERLELEFSLKRSDSEVQKLQPESTFYKASLAEANEQLRVLGKEKAMLEQALARSEARGESLEVQLRDKAEVGIVPLSDLYVCCDKLCGANDLRQCVPDVCVSALVAGGVDFAEGIGTARCSGEEAR